MVPVFVQEGVPWLLEQNAEVNPVRFPTSCLEAEKIFREYPQIQHIIFRANFKLGECLGSLPALRHAGLISTGTDNLPVEELTKRKIETVTGEGANARAVFEYVIQALFHFWEEEGKIKEGVGIIGYGRIGSLLGRFLRKAEIPFAFYDPFVEGSSSKKEVLNFPIVTFHVPLTRSGEHATYRMLTENYFGGRRPFMIHTARGEIWDAEYYSGERVKNRIWAQDVYPQEPPPEEWVEQSHFSTPHIAGYSTHGRLGGLYRVLSVFFPEVTLPPVPHGELWWLAKESSRLKSNPQNFSQRRDTFPWRKEFSEFSREDWQAFHERFTKVPEKFRNILEEDLF